MESTRLQPDSPRDRSRRSPAISDAGASPDANAGRATARSAPLGESVTALWGPHCKMPFLGRLDADASFVHPACGGRSAIDLALLDDLASDSWFWRRYRDRLQRGGRPA